MISKGYLKCPLKTSRVSSPLGPWEVAACNEGLHSVNLSGEVTNDNFLDLGCNPENVELQENSTNEHIQQFGIWMRGYFKATEYETLNKANIPEICKQVIPSKDNCDILTFRQNVWSILKEKVAFGETISYGELARLCSESGKSSAASRAVGGAMANNPISLVVPCHRVVKANGSAGNYSKCTKNNVKLWLLNHEKSNC